LVALLRVDLPWWSYGLTDVAAMAAWRPGSAMTHPRPRFGDYAGEHFDRLRPADGSPADRALRALADLTDRTLAVGLGLWPAGRDCLLDRPGLRHAAAALLGPESPLPAPPAVILDALRCRTKDSDLAVRAVRTGCGWEVLRAAMVYYELLVVDRGECSPMAQEWCDRLVAVDSQCRDEIGYHWVRWAADGMNGHAPQQYWRDPLNPLVWAISSADGTVYATVGSRMPARGRVEEVAIEDRRPFFRDSAGDAFPVPKCDLSNYRTSGGSVELTAAILALMDDAARDVYHCHLAVDILDVRATGLYKATGAGKGTISRSELEQLREETPEGVAERERIRARVAVRPA
jgi:hypothetical protein